MPQNEKILSRFILFFVFPVLFVYAAIFCNQRIYGDAAAYLFTVINTEAFNINHMRPSAVFVEWIPLVLLKLHAPMQYVLYGFSLGECFYYFIWYLVFTRLLKAPGYGIAMVLVYLFGLRWNYFNPVTELVLAFPFAFLLAWFWQQPPGKVVWWYVNSLALSVFLCFSHPLYVIIIPLLFTFLFLNQLVTKQNIVFGVCFLVLGIAKYSLLNNYEKYAVADGIQTLNIAHAFSHLFSVATIIDLVKACAGILFLEIIFLTYLYKTKQYKRFGLLSFFILIYFSYIWVKYDTQYPNTYEPIERYFFIIPLIIGVLISPYINLLSKTQRNIVIVLTVWHIFYIGVYGHFVKQRYVAFDYALQNSMQFKENKILYRNENYYYTQDKYTGHDWTMCFESLLLTATQSPQHARQVYIKEILPDTFYRNLGENDFLLSYQFSLANVSRLNKHYMQLQPSAWRMANSDSVQTGLDSIITKIGIAINPPKTLRVDEYHPIDIKLTNPTSMPLFSGTRKQYRGICYLWKNNLTGHIEKGKHDTRLMCDLYTRIQQKITLYGPSLPGNYTLILGYTTAGPFTFIPFNNSFQVAVK